MPDPSFLLIQALGLFPSVVCFTSLQSGSRKKILRLQMGCALLWACHYGLLGAYTAVLTNCLGLFRAVLCYHNDKPWAKSRGWVFLLLGLYCQGCALVTWDGPYCLLPLPVHGLHHPGPVDPQHGPHPAALSGQLAPSAGL